MHHPQLRIELEKVVDQIDTQIMEAGEAAYQLNIGVSALRTPDGSWVMNDLLVAKATALAALAGL